MRVRKTPQAGAHPLPRRSPPCTRGRPKGSEGKPVRMERLRLMLLLQPQRIHPACAEVARHDVHAVKGGVGPPGAHGRARRGPFAEDMRRLRKKRKLIPARGKPQAVMHRPWQSARSGRKGYSRRRAQPPSQAAPNPRPTRRSPVRARPGRAFGRAVR